MPRLFAPAAAALLLVLHAGAHAQTAAADFPNKPVTLVTPFAAGSGPDAVLRLVSDKLSRLWGQRVVVDNKPGGGGFIAIDQAKRAAPDGYTLLQLDSEHIAALPHLYKSRNFVTLQHFDPVASLFRTPFFVAVGTDSKWKNMSDLIADAKAHPGQVSYGSWGVGSPGHLGGQQLDALAGTRMQHVPYREVSQLFANVGAGDVPWSFASIPSSQGIYKAGKLRYLAIAAPKRIPQMPDVPTMAEAGGPPSLEVNSFVSLLAPKGVPAAVKAKINADVAKVIADPEIRARFDTFAFEPLAWSPEEIQRNAEAKSKVYGELVRIGNISLE
ncbi:MULTISPECIES: tripartite tricarboxylate transporter substrate binding protein [unclassified Variovorax]|uniref:Bug family tripartite tricarboxylate transporter substrate binding protein n=1 Tax=unclassified Variovorax TaxID=663243 RepID=UPI002576A41D|nr:MULTISPECIES: tripartite tricarboxylate transporter substrate binding protein [unclassified Variovorax]MDM0091316.1 tripartite tricarboxylate transporter substrate binding protein [Variovorax sp. J22G40]MDM0149457.1 tripartite tricarboxylate transporter substrate binding protein [Variovorax sp. J2P1-31]